MFQWLRTLQFHNFGMPRDEGQPQHPWARAKVFKKDAKPDGNTQESEGQGQESSSSPISTELSQAAESENLTKDVSGDAKSEGGDKMTQISNGNGKKTEPCSAENKGDSEVKLGKQTPESAPR